MRPGHTTAPGLPEHRVPSLDEVPPAPRTPTRPARRVVFAFAGRERILRVVGLGFAAGGLLLSAVIGWGLPVDLTIALAGTKTTGTVAEVHQDRSTRITGQHPWRVRYRYEVDGLARTGANTMLATPPDPGASVAIEYVPFLPEWSRVAGSMRAPLGWAGLFPIAFVVLGLVIVAHAMRANRRQIRAFVHGRPALARVTFRGEDESVEVNGRRPFMLRWEFRVPSGEVFEGSITSMRLLELEPFGDAEQVVVLYDPEDPGCNTLYVA